MGRPFLMMQLLKHPLFEQNKKHAMLFFQVMAFVVTFLVGEVFYMSRKPIIVVKNTLLVCHNNSTHCSSWFTELDGRTEHQAKTLLGVLDSSFLISYAIGTFVSGYLAERVDIRYFLSAGMILSGLLVCMLGLSLPLDIHTIWYFIPILIVAGLVQSSGWIGVVSVMANWFGKDRRGFIMGLWIINFPLGNILGSLVAGSFVSSNWSLSFILPGLSLIFMGIVVFLVLVPKPIDINMNSNEEDTNNNNNFEKQKAKNTAVVTISNTSTANDTVKEEAIGFIGALKIGGVVEFALCLFFSLMVSYSFLYWLPNYIHGQSGINAEKAAFLSTIYDVGGIFGGILAGVMTDKTGMSATTCSCMIALAVPVMLTYQYLISHLCPISQMNGVPVHDSCFFISNFVLFLTGIVVIGPCVLILTAVSAELGQNPRLSVSKKALTTVTSIINGTGFLGTIVGGIIIGPLSSGGNWENVIYMLMIADTLALLLLSRQVKNEISKYQSSRKLYVINDM